MVRSSLTISIPVCKFATVTVTVLMMEPDVETVQSHGVAAQRRLYETLTTANRLEIGISQLDEEWLLHVKHVVISTRNVIYSMHRAKNSMSGRQKNER
jgi:hypothetical protein